MTIDSSSRRRLLAQSLALGSLAAAGLPASAQAFPSRPVRLVVPYAPGGSTDVLARMFAEPFSRDLGQPVVVENRPGAATNIGLEVAARSPANGYTLLFSTTSGLVLNPAFGPVPSVDVIKEITPVSLVASMPMLVAANPKLPASTPKELVALAKANPDKLTIGTASLATQVGMLNIRAGIQLRNVAYKGGAPATTDAIAGHVDLVMAGLPALLTYVRSGKLKAIAISADQRSAAAPDIPTFQESGFGGPPTSWFATFVPAGTPADVVARLNRAAVAACADAELNRRMLAEGMEVKSSSPREMAELHRRDLDMAFALAKQLR